ncbi:hypothetical protein EWM64_g1199 [Hericium alpestre]|uniref:FACT complex subunit n=1 Tax=Hericium alpestre TaxID=135208 RepID=A0A4Z0A8F6_9AGAM|nr:hypothetical protein EWM64_g1199 [Hericium alpestre]
MHVELNKDLFNARLKCILDSWSKANKNDDLSTIADVDALFLAAGDPSAEDEPIRKGVAFQTWLLGYEFPSTLLLFQKDKLSVLCSVNKAKILQQLQTHGTIVPVDILIYSKAKDSVTEGLPDIMKTFLSQHRVGLLTKESFSGKLAEEWNRALSSAESKPELVDIGPAISFFMAVKNDDELIAIRTAANLTTTLLTHHIAPRLETILDRETKISHEQFAAQIEARLGSGDDSNARGPDMRIFNKGRGLSDTEVLNKMKDGALIKDIYQHALTQIKKHKPELEKNFVKNFGFGMGLEFRDAVYLLSPKNARQLKTNMVFNLSLGFQDLEDQDDKKYALQVVDTVKIGYDKAVSITEGIKSAKDVMFYLNSPETKVLRAAEKPFKKVAANGNGSPMKSKIAGGKVLRNKTRSAAQVEVAQSTAARIAEHQKELHDQLQAEGLARYAEENGGTGGKEGKSWKRFQSYKGEAGLPREAESLRIYVDRKAHTVVLPIYGFAVPFHINTIKNVSKNDEGDFTYIRVNFQTPGQLAGKKEDTPFEDPDATFVRSISYRSADGHRFDAISKQITDLKKEVNKREQQKKELADVIEQDILVEVKGRRPHKLPEVFVRPALDGKRLPGEVEIHQNGLRYQSPMGTQKIDVLFSNVKHLFFQPCDHELLVIIHIHLKAPIMIGKKKAHDIQFFREASDVQFDETGNRKRKYRYGDEDEIEMEQQERKRRQMLNKEFKAFSEKIAEAATVSPTTECLVHLSDPPFLVVSLADIEIASLERVRFGLKQFDLIFVFRDFSKAPLHINSIPSSQLDDVKNWLE